MSFASVAAITAAVAASISATISGYAAYTSGQSQRAQAEYQAQLAERNAEQERISAEATRQQGEYERQRQIQANETALAHQRNILAASGAVISEGTPLLIMEETAAQQSRDLDMMKYKTDMAALGYEVRAKNSDAQSPLYSLQASTANTNSYLNAASSLLGGISQAAGYLGKPQKPADAPKTDTSNDEEDDSGD
jgi:hypothetical protein